MLILNRFDHWGYPIWAVQFAAPAYNGRILTVDSTEAGDVFVGGTLGNPTRVWNPELATTANITCGNTPHAFAARLDGKTGNMTWHSCLGPQTANLPTRVNSMTVDSGGTGFVVQGYYSGGTLTLGSTTLPANGGGYVARYNLSTDTWDWAIFMRSARHSDGTSIRRDAAGNYYVPVLSQGQSVVEMNGEFNVTLAGNGKSVIIVKISPAGKVLSALNVANKNPSQSHEWVVSLYSILL